MKKTASLAKTAALMGIIILIAKCMGLVRDTMVATTFGTSLFATAYETASKLPITIFDFVLGGVVTAAFIPVYHGIAHERGKKEALSFANAYLNLILLITAVLSLLGVVASPLLVQLFAPKLAPECSMLAVTLSRIMFPMVICVGVAFTFVGFLQAEDEYNIPAVISLVSNCIMVGYLALAPLWIEDLRLTVIGLAISMLLGWCAQAAVQIPAVKKRGFVYKPNVSPFTPDTLHAMKNALPILMATWTAPVCTLINTRIASDIKGGRAISALGYANRLYIIIVGLFSFVATNLLFPYFSRAAVSGDTRESDRLTRLSIRILTYIIAPISVGVAVLARPFVALIYERNAFTADDTDITAQALCFYAIGMLFTALCEVLTKAFFAVEKTRYPMLAAAASMCFNIAALFAYTHLASTLTVGAIALISGLSAGVQLLVIFVLACKKRILMPRGEDVLDCTKSLVSALLMGAAASLVYRFIPLTGALAFLISVLIGVIVYILLTALLRSAETQAVFAVLLRRGAKKEDSE